MNRILTTVFALVFICAALSGCGSPEQSKEPSAKSQDDSATSTATTTTTENSTTTAETTTTTIGTEAPTYHCHLHDHHLANHQWQSYRWQFLLF